MNDMQMVSSLLMKLQRMYYEGTRPEDFGELGDGYMI